MEVFSQLREFPDNLPCVQLKKKKKTQTNEKLNQDKWNARTGCELSFTGSYFECLLSRLLGYLEVGYGASRR